MPPVPQFPLPPPPPVYGPGTAGPVRRRGLPLLITGAAVAVLGVIGMLYIGRAQSICDSGLGTFAQALSHQDATYCSQDSDFHTVSVLALVAGLILIGAGALRMVTSPRLPGSPGNDYRPPHPPGGGHRRP
jgi:hypothetical protein